MLRFLRKNMKVVLIFVIVAFSMSVFLGISFFGGGGGGAGQNQIKTAKGFLLINGKEVDPSHYSRIYNRLRSNFPARLSPKEMLYLESMAMSQTIDFSLMLAAAKQEVKVSGSELNQAIENIAKSQKVPSVGRLKKIVQRSGGNWNSLKKAIKEDLLVQKLISKKNKEVKVSPNDLREINVRHILIRHQKGKEEDVEERVKRIFVKARGGEDFAKLAKKYSEDPGSKVKGGDLGYFTTGAMVPPFEEAAFKLKIREISQPIKTDFGYHIIKLENSRLRKISGQKDIEKAIMQEKQQKFFSDWMFNLKKDTKIKIIDASLRALDLRLKGKLNEAVFEYNKAIAENPGNAYPHIFLASLYEELDKNELAVSEYKAAIDLSSGDPTFYILLGDLLVKMNNKSAAIKQYKKASIIAGDKKMIHEELVTKFKKLRSNANVQKELQEISRISKKEAFEKGLLDKQQKLKTE